MIPNHINNYVKCKWSKHSKKCQWLSDDKKQNPTKCSIQITHVNYEVKERKKNKIMEMYYITCIILDVLYYN